MKQTGIWLVRQEALPVAQRLQSALDADIVDPRAQSEISPRELFEQEFNKRHRWIFVGAAGIAVRFLTGLPANKHKDPAVVVLDEGCRYAISLLSGHEGGANELAFEVANIFGSVPVVTTATESLKPLVIGIGCRKGTSSQTIETVVLRALDGKAISQVRLLATIDVKESEPGLLEFAAKYRLPLQIFRAQDVAPRAWVSTPSEWVKKVTGADGVCEPCALMASIRGKLIVPKFTADGVAVAIVEDSHLADLEALNEIYTVPAPRCLT